MSMTFLDPTKFLGKLTGADQAAEGAQKAADAQVQSGREANTLQKYMYDTTRDDNSVSRTAGNGATTQMMALNGLNPDGTKSSAPVDYSVFTNSPGYKFGMDQGMQGVQRQLAAGGMTGSGAALKEMNNYAQGYAGQGFSNFYNRLAGMAGQGQNATNATDASGANYANNAGQNLLGMGNAQASSYIAKGNVQANNFNNLLKIGGAAAGAFGGGA